MTKYIPLEELEKIIANIEKFYADNHWVIRVLKRDIEFIETIDPEATIDEMIEELTFVWAWLMEINARNTLRELKSKLLLTK